jgi:hypothetical protein
MLEKLTKIENSNIYDFIGPQFRLTNYHNALEPISLVKVFLENPPENFIIQNIPSNHQDIYGFFADLDLFTTLDEAAKEIVNKIRRIRAINFIIKKFFTPNVLFIGTTVSEYCLLPCKLILCDFKANLFSIFKKSNRQFLIIKDIPSNSPLLTEQENNESEKLISYLKDEEFILLTGQALAYLPINFNSMEGYLAKFSSNRRNNFRRKMKIKPQIAVEEINTGDEFFTNILIGHFYSLYLNIYKNSDIHFDKLTLTFFKQLLQNTVDGKVFIYSYKDKIIGFNICYIIEDKLVDKYRGSLYPEAEETNLFFNIFFENINYCLKNNLKTYIIGWTAPKVKSYLGCIFTYTNHAIYIKNPILRHFLTFFKSHFEGDKSTIEKLNLEK